MLGIFKPGPERNTASLEVAIDMEDVEKSIVELDARSDTEFARGCGALCYIPAPKPCTVEPEELDAAGGETEAGRFCTICGFCNHEPEELDRRPGLRAFVICASCTKEPEDLDTDRDPAGARACNACLHCHPTCQWGPENLDIQ